MSLTPGARLGSYEVTAEIGRGGMGEVYQARDTKLDRDVALKVLPDAFTSDPDRLARFEREAKVLASLNHPNIGHIYGLEEAEGGKFRALVLELVEGPTLADRIAEGPISVDEALPIAKQIADALEAAHEQGIIHRDLKPANVKVKADGTVKVLDFGLAKAFQPDPESDPSQSPTLTAAATQAGIIMGTAAYMAPEQAKGKLVDKRADVWAFGVVLYEMLTAKRAFAGQDASDTLAFVLTKGIDWTTLATTVPAAVRQLLQRCIERDVKLRLRDIGEARIVLSDPSTLNAASDQAVESAPAPRVWQRPVPLAVASVILALATALGVWNLAPRSQVESRPATHLTLNLVPTDRFANQGLALSPDGRVLVYVAMRDGVPYLFRRSMAERQPLLIAGTEGAFAPFFSPDGSSVGFYADDALKTVALAGGTPQTLCPAGTTGIYWGANWNDDGTITFSAGGGIKRVSAAGGVPQPITESSLLSGEEGEGIYQLGAHLLPGGRGMLFTSFASVLRADRIAVYSPGAEEHTDLLEGTSPHYVDSGHIVFARANTLWAVPFDLEQLEIRGEPTPLVEGIHVSSPGFGQFAVGEDGTLVYASSTPTGSSLVWIDRDGAEQPLRGAPIDRYQGIALSPDGDRVALDLTDPATGTKEVWVHDVERGTRQQITDHPAADLAPLWSLDGEQVVFGSNRDGDPGLYSVKADGTGDVERLMLDREATLAVAPEGWSADGTRLLFVGVYAGTLFDIGLLSLGSEQEVELLVQTDGGDWFPRVSPTGRWLAYTSDRTGQEEVYVERFPEMSERVPVTTGGGRHPEWSPDGTELFYLTLDGRQLMRVSVGTGATFDASVPEMALDGPFVASGGFRRYAIAPDAQRFLMMKPAVATDTLPTELNVVLDWTQELLARVPVE